MCYETLVLDERPDFMWRGHVRIWLDDIRLPPEGWVWCKTIESAKALLMEKGVIAVSFDHDLGDGNETGYDLAKWVEEKAHDGELPSFLWHLHSANADGCTRIAAAMSSAERYWQERTGKE